MWLKRLFCGLLLCCFSWSVFSEPGTLPQGLDLLDNSIESLLRVGQELTNLQTSATKLQALVTALESDSTASKADLELQRALLTTYQSKVETLKKHYESLLIICEKLKQSYKAASTLNVVLGVSTGVAIITAIIIAVGKSK